MPKEDSNQGDKRPSRPRKETGKPGDRHDPRKAANFKSARPSSANPSERYRGSDRDTGFKRSDKPGFGTEKRGYDRPSGQSNTETSGRFDPNKKPAYKKFGGDTDKRASGNYGKPDSGISKERGAYNRPEPKREGFKKFGSDSSRGEERGSYGSDRKPPFKKFGSDASARPTGNRSSASSRGSSFGDSRNPAGNDRPNTGFKRFEGDRSKSTEDKPEIPKSRYGNKQPNRFSSDRSGKSEFKSFGSKESTGRPTRNDKSTNEPTYHESKMLAKLPEKIREKVEKENQAKDDSIRLNRYIANAGLCSRREADDMIASGMIKVNGNVIVEMGYKVKPGDTVKYGKDLLSREKMVYILLNKPKDYITTMDDPNERKTVMDLIKNACKERVYPVGRLDRNTTGLLLLTNDGELTEKLTHPTNNIKKIYQVEIDKPITSEDFEKLQEGLELEDGFAKPDQVGIVTPDAQVIGIEIHSGKNRIVRRMFEHLGYEVTKLDRTTFAGLTKKDLPRGNWKFLNEKELIRLKYML